MTPKAASLSPDGSGSVHDGNAKKNDTAITKNDDDEEEVVMFREDFELTWPIWHMLPRHEKKSLSEQYGYKTIGDFEEYMTLRRALTDGEEAERSIPYDNSLLYDKPSLSNTTADSNNSDSVIVSIRQLSMDDKESKTSSNTAKLKTQDDGGDDDDDRSTTTNDDDELKRLADLEKETDLSESELIDVGGLLMMIPEEIIIHNIFSFLSVDTYAALALVSPHWKFITRTELIYKRLCERIYLKQSRKKVLHIHKFGGSYRNMLYERPRVRAGDGLYILKYSQVKKIQRDMWTEIPVGAILETVYYRYLYFQEDGTVLYALATTSPKDMLYRFWKASYLLKSNDSANFNNFNHHNTEESNSNSSIDKSIVWGHYQIQKNKVVVVAKQPWHTVKMEMSIQPSGIGCGRRFASLSFDKHLSSPSGNFNEYEWPNDIVEYKVPNEYFRFIKDKRL